LLIARLIGAEVGNNLIDGHLPELGLKLSVAGAEVGNNLIDGHRIKRGGHPVFVGAEVGNNLIDGHIKLNWLDSVSM